MLNQGKFYLYVQPGCKTGNIKTGTVKFTKFQNLLYIVRAYLNVRPKKLPEIFWRSVVASGLVPWRGEFQVELVEVKTTEEANSIIKAKEDEEDQKQRESEEEAYTQEQAEKYSVSSKAVNKEGKPTLH